jgi:hypothetical protein
LVIAGFWTLLAVLDLIVTTLTVRLKNGFFAASSSTWLLRGWL